MKRIDTLGYPVRIGSGLIGEAALPPGRLFLVTDENVGARRLARPARRRLRRAASSLAPGEAARRWPTLEALLDALIEARIGRGDHVVAVGGGVVGDVAGFAAALLKRGCGWIAVPTTLLAQADSAVGGKTGVNARQGKNLIGAFHPPALVLIDPDALDTLPARRAARGLCRGGQIRPDRRPRFLRLVRGGMGRRCSPATKRRGSMRSKPAWRAKAALVAGDERDTRSKRALLNFGHSFGHAIEAETGLRARRGGRRRHGPRLPPVGRRAAFARPETPGAWPPISTRRPADRRPTPIRRGSPRGWRTTRRDRHWS